MAENLERIEALTTRLMSALSNRELHDPGVDAPGPEFFMSAGLALTRMWAEQPAKIIEQQVGFWGQTLAHYARAQGQFVRGRVEAEDAPKKDRRFSNPLWDTHPYFNFVKQQYQINAAAMREAAAMLDMPDATGRQRLDWLTNQIVDMFAPTNFLATNPDAIEMALETEGESLVRGLENLVRDVEENNGELVVTLSDREAFKVGENIGTTPGEVVRRAPMYELIQFTPTTDKVHEVPLLIFPPWINKFYILDLKPQNSMIRWLVDQGFTLFVVSWKNADASHADVGLDDYVAAYRDAMAAVCEISGQEQLNAVGYCIGGTTLSLTLGLMAQQGQDMVRTATLFTTLTDFADQGEFTPFLQDDFVSGIESETLRTGYLDGRLMGRTMSFLRANDLVWGPAIRSYLMGQAPPAFDLLYWNGDATNLPGRMTREYLRLLCQQNSLVGDGYPIADKKITLSDVKIPIFAIACETDHIAPWKHSWRGVSQMGSDNRNFILAQSGHIAGIVNPPSKGKYGHYAGSDDFSGTPEEWREQTTFHEGTWWPRWGAWLAENSGKMVAAREPQAGISPAPGTYVHEKAW
ncbi:MAG: class I poly(R)-hydroxyalkanoic acid synthase [Paracoccus sp. (in: a-proteobacteria)]|nr:class I poly(R)-hydroxyalkanoic acid synthase [Paracoccus sp. (in: a-proteobacteria)]